MHDVIFYAHIGSLCLAGLGVLFADHLAFDWMRGKRPSLEDSAIHKAHWIVTIGLSGLILTGLYLFWPMQSYLVHQPLFWLKMFFVGALAINSLFIERLMPTASRPYATLERGQRAPLMVSGAVSTVSWIGAICVAIMFFS